MMAAVGLAIFDPRDSVEMPGCWRPWLAALATTLTTIVVMFLILVAAMCGQRLISTPHTGPAAEGSGELGWNKRSFLL